jgi:hypothetical protein
MLNHFSYIIDLKVAFHILPVISIMTLLKLTIFFLPRKIKKIDKTEKCGGLV